MKNWKPTVCAIVLTNAVLAVSASPASGLADFGAEEFVQAGGVNIDVLGYSVPSFADWNNDGLEDLVLGEGSGTYTPKVRVYLNGGVSGAPQFFSYFYAQSSGSDLTVPGGG